MSHQKQPIHTHTQINSQSHICSVRKMTVSMTSKHVRKSLSKLLTIASCINFNIGFFVFLTIKTHIYCFFSRFFDSKLLMTTFLCQQYQISTFERQTNTSKLNFNTSKRVSAQKSISSTY